MEGHLSSTAPLHWGCGWGRWGPSQGHSWIGLFAGTGPCTSPSSLSLTFLVQPPPQEWGLEGPGHRSLGWGVELCLDVCSAVCLLPSLLQKREIRSNKLSPYSRRPPPSFPGKIIIQISDVFVCKTGSSLLISRAP